jgi:hypothetical protein
VFGNAPPIARHFRLTHESQIAELTPCLCSSGKRSWLFIGLGSDHPDAFALFNEQRVYELLRQGRSYYAFQ